MAEHQAWMAALIVMIALGVAVTPASGGEEELIANSAAPSQTEAVKPRLWIMVRTSSFQTTPKTERVCINPVGMKALFTDQSGSADSSCQQQRTVNPDRSTRIKVTCTTTMTCETSVTSTSLKDISADKRIIHQHLDIRSEPALAPALDKAQWLESTMTDAGDCPVSMRQDQAMVVIQSDGSTTDPIQAMSDRAKRQKEEETAFAAGAPEAAIAASPDPAKARVISIQVKDETACAWVDTGGRDSVMPVSIIGLVNSSGKVTFTGRIAPIDGEPIHERVDGAFLRELDIVECGANLPAKPAGVVEDSSIYGPLAQLWATPKVKWAIIPAMGDPGYLGVRRRTGGGDIQTPVFSSAGAVQAWIASAGDQQADAVEAAGDKLMKTSGACIAKAKGDEWRDCPDWPTDLTVLKKDRD